MSNFLEHMKNFLVLKHARFPLVHNYLDAGTALWVDWSGRNGFDQVCYSKCAEGNVCFSSIRSYSKCANNTSVTIFQEDIVSPTQHKHCDFANTEAAYQYSQCSQASEFFSQWLPDILLHLDWTTFTMPIRMMNWRPTMMVMDQMRDYTSWKCTIIANSAVLSYCIGVNFGSSPAIPDCWTSHSRALAWRKLEIHMKWMYI